MGTKSTRNMVVKCSSVMFVAMLQTTRRHIPLDRKLNTNHPANVISCILKAIPHLTLVHIHPDDKVYTAGNALLLF